MQYQNMLCLGDSQTFGARTYGCYPVYLARILTNRTPYQWRTINRSANGYTARDLWNMVNQQVDLLDDTFQACVLIGANDVGNRVPIDLFEEYYRQIIRALLIRKYKAIYCGEIPPIFADGHVFFPRSAAGERGEYNNRIKRIASEDERLIWVPIRDLSRDCYVDPVHFNELGNQRVAESFALAIIAR